MEEGLLKHLADADASVRGAATAVAALLPKGAAALRARLSGEKKEEVLASLLIALGCTGDRSSCQSFLHAKNPRIQGGAALGLVLAEGFPRSPAAELIAALAQNLCLPSTNEKLFPWFGHSPGRAVLRLVALGNPQLLDAAVDSLLVAAKEPTVMRESLVGKALSLRFSRLPEPKTTTSTAGYARQRYRRQMLDPSRLDAKQRALLEQLSEWPLASVRNNNLTDLDKYGFPLDLSDRRIWLGLDPEGVLDEPITTSWQGKPRTWRSIKEWIETEQELAVAAYDKDPSRWPHELLAEAMKPVVDQWDPVMRLRLALEQHRLDGRLAFIDPDVEAALKHDRQATRAALERARDRELTPKPPGAFNHEVLKLYMASLDENEMLDPRMDEVLVHSHVDFSEVGLQHMPAERKKAFIERHAQLAHHGRACFCPPEKQGLP